MHDHETQRLDFLKQGPCAPAEYLSDYYGLTSPFEGELLEDYNAWTPPFRGQPPCTQTQFSRWKLESFLQAKRIVSKKWMGARLGVKAAIVDQILDGLPKIGLRKKRYEAYADLLSDSLPEDLANNLPGLRFRTFSDHNSFCELLHARLLDDLHVEIPQAGKLFCATSGELDEPIQSYANAFDCITLKPLSTRHAMWLDFRKPLSLGPDRCSILFYAQNHDDLKPWHAGTREPANLDEYLQVAQGGA